LLGGRCWDRCFAEGGLALGTLAAVNRGRPSPIGSSGLARWPAFYQWPVCSSFGVILIQYVGFRWALLRFTGRNRPVWAGRIAEA